MWVEVVVDVGMGFRDGAISGRACGCCCGEIWTGTRRTTTSTDMSKNILVKRGRVTGTMRAERLGQQRAESDLFVKGAYHMTDSVIARLEAFPRP